MIEHVSDVARLHVLMEVGGMYVDPDAIFLKSVDELRNQKIVMPQEREDGLRMYNVLAIFICFTTTEPNRRLFRIPLKLSTLLYGFGVT